MKGGDKYGARINSEWRLGPDPADAFPTILRYTNDRQGIFGKRKEPRKSYVLPLLRNPLIKTQTCGFCCPCAPKPQADGGINPDASVDCYGLVQQNRDFWPHTMPSSPPYLGWAC